MFFFTFVLLLLRNRCCNKLYINKDLVIIGLKYTSSMNILNNMFVNADFLFVRICLNEILHENY